MFLWRLFISSCNSNAFCLSIEGKKRCRKTLQLHISSTETTSIRMESPDVERNCRWKSNRRHVIRKHWLHSMHSTLSAWNMHTYNVYSRAPDCAKWCHVVTLARLLVFPRTFYFITLLIWFCSHLPRDTAFHLLPGTVATVTICTDSDKVVRWDLSVVWLLEVAGQLAANVLWAFF